MKQTGRCVLYDIKQLVAVSCLFFYAGAQESDKVNLGIIETGVKGQESKHPYLCFPAFDSLQKPAHTGSMLAVPIKIARHAYRVVIKHNQDIIHF